MAGPRSAGQCAAGRDRVRCATPQLQGPARGVCALTGVSDGLAHAPASVLGPQRRAKRSNAHFLHARAALRQTRLSDRCTAMYKPRMQRPRAQQARWSARGHAPTFFWACLAPRPPLSSARSFTHSAVPIGLFEPVQRPSRPLLSTCNGAQTRKAAPSGSRTISRAHTAATNSSNAAAACGAAASSAAARGGGGGATGSRSCHLFDWRQRSDGRCAAGAEHMGGESLLPMQLLQPFAMLGAPCK